MENAIARKQSMEVGIIERVVQNYGILLIYTFFCSRGNTIKAYPYGRSHTLEKLIH